MKNIVYAIEELEDDCSWVVRNRTIYRSKRKAEKELERLNKRYRKSRRAFQVGELYEKR